MLAGAWMLNTHIGMGTGNIYGNRALVMAGYGHGILVWDLGIAAGVGSGGTGPVPGPAGRILSALVLVGQFQG